MKKRILLTCLLTSFSFLLSPLSSLLSAQVPHSFSYQAVVRGNNGEPIAYQNTNFRISLLLGSDAGPTSYQEIHLQTTNFFGLVNLQIGNGTVVIGVFDTLSWSSSSYYIKIEADTAGGNDFVALGTTQLLAVPYALHAEDASSAVASTMIQDSDGETRVTTELNANDNKIRFYTGGLERWRMTQGRLEVFDTNENIFIGERSGENNTTGFSNVYIGHVTGRDNTSGGYNVFLGDSTGVYNTVGMNNTFIGGWSGTANTSGSNNTFVGADAGENNQSGMRNVYMGWYAGFSGTTGSGNTLIGTRAGLNNNGCCNTYIGLEAGFHNTTGSRNIYLGTSAGFNNQSGSSNIFIGQEAGGDELGSNKLYIDVTSTSEPLIYGEFDSKLLRFHAGRIEIKNQLENTIVGDNAGISAHGGGNIYIGSRAAFSDTTGWDNVYIGKDAGYSNATANRNVFIGTEAGKMSTSGNFNVIIGWQTGMQNTSGTRNTFLGCNAGWVNTTGHRNTFIGLSAGGANVSGSYNTYIGRCAGWTNIEGSNNVFIGNFAGAYELGSDKLYISNSETSEPLIYGNFAAKKLKFWADTTETDGKLMASGEVRTDHQFNVYGQAGINSTLNHITAFDFTNDKLKYRTTLYRGGIITYMSEESGWVDTVGEPILPCGQVGLVGEFNLFGDAGPDHAMTRNEYDPYIWSTAIKLTAADSHWAPDTIVEMKFRANEDWNYFWGGSEFPSGTAHINSQDNINVPLNSSFDTTVYHVTFNCKTGVYTFEDQSGSCAGSMTDTRDGRRYATILIGTQCWMAENLNAGIRIDGYMNQTNNSTTEKYCYDDSEANCDNFGGLYQWNEAMQYSTIEGSQGICPAGWHIPTDQELKTLEGTVDTQYGIGDPVWDEAGCRGNDAGTHLKSTSGWPEWCTGDNLFGFNILHVGFRNLDGYFIFNDGSSFLWSSSQMNEDGAVWPRNFPCHMGGLCRDFDTVEYGWSVRCIKN